ncbi:hypothetical protein O181_088901 [Austropuccinia psidii MF-1]|uniref:Uncharacterized protein n=1 Tax=Austropuccinia psidii MF-1 TaxID=1389203 RepID=A0A9Q3P7C3_9BASI|nr:hypothetical protein [Austropuccinia psidii MF-1]
MEYQILERQTGNVKITNNAIFVPNVFPKQATSETNIITDLPWITSSLEPQITSDNSTTINIECLEESHPEPLTTKPSDPNSNTNLLNKKRRDNYKFIPENQPPSS